MKPPPLPETFGNYALGDFAEIAAPDPISWLPQTAGWLWVGALILLLVVRSLLKRLQTWHANRYRREASLRLRVLQTRTPPEAFVMELNKLLKLTAIVGYSRAEVAPLTGAAWVEFLNNQCINRPFSPQQTDWLALGPYSGRLPDAETRAGLAAAAAAWIQAHGDTASA